MIKSSAPNMDGKLINYQINPLNRTITFEKEGDWGYFWMPMNKVYAVDGYPIFGKTLISLARELASHLY